MNTNEHSLCSIYAKIKVAMLLKIFILKNTKSIYITINDENENSHKNEKKFFRERAEGKSMCGWSRFL